MRLGTQPEQNDMQNQANDKENVGTDADNSIPDQNVSESWDRMTCRMKIMTMKKS